MKSVGNPSGIHAASAVHVECVEGPLGMRAHRAHGVHFDNRTHDSFLIRRQRGHPGVVLPLAIFKSAND